MTGIQRPVSHAYAAAGDGHDADALHFISKAPPAYQPRAITPAAGQIR